MSNKEKCIALLNNFSDGQLANIAVMLQATLDAVADAADNAFCASLYEEYLEDADRGQAVSLEEAAAALGVDL